MEKVAEAPGGGAVSSRWTDIDPTKYDEVHEVQGLELDAGSFISPYDVPDGVRLLCPHKRSYLIQLRYLTDQEEIELTETERPEIHFGLGRHSSRLVSLKVAATKRFPEWEEVALLLSKLISQRNLTNHFVARTVLRDSWSRLAERVRELRTG